MSVVRRLAANLKRLRADRDLSQQRLASAAGVSRATIAAIEGARYASVESTTIENLARALKLPTTELIESPKRAD